MRHLKLIFSNVLFTIYFILCEKKVVLYIKNYIIKLLLYISKKIECLKDFCPRILVIEGRKVGGVGGGGVGVGT